MSLPQEDTSPISIILAGTNESAAQSLPGLLSKEKRENIKIHVPDIENERELTLDIQSLIASFGDREVRVYGPAYFDTISASTTQRVYNAFLNVAAGYPQDHVQFFIYETQPDATEFSRTHVMSVQKILEDQTGLLLTKILLSQERVYQIPR